MSRIAERLAAVGLELPAASTPVADYVPATRAGDVVFTSGQLPMVAGRLMATGSVDADVDVEHARACAAQCALNALAAAATVCDLDEVQQAVKLVGYVASSPGFLSQPEIVDAASHVLVAAFGEAGSHAREAVGVAELPLGSPVEISLVLRIT
jgi:enamine deaminase RidA (YjgF/YER057c/UK114 family)